MKRTIFLGVFFVTSSLVAFAQIPTSDVIDPQTLVHYIQELQNLASQVQNGIQELQEADQMVQYQILALQQLSTGTWQSFVNAWDLETDTLNNFAELAAQIQPIKDSIDMPTFMKTWNAASNIVHSTDYLVKDTKSRQQMWQQQMANSSTNQGVVGQLQTVNEGLGLLGGEVRDINLNLGAWKDYFVATMEIQDANAQLGQDVIDSYYSTDYLANTGAPVDLSHQDDQLTQQPAW